MAYRLKVTIELVGPPDDQADAESEQLLILTRSASFETLSDADVALAHMLFARNNVLAGKYHHKS